MKVRMELEIDLSTGSYDIKLHNQSTPGGSIDLARVTRVVSRVMDNVAAKSTDTPSTTSMFPAHKSFIN